MDAVLLTKIVALEAPERRIDARAHAYIARHAQRDGAEPHAQTRIDVRAPGTGEVERQRPGTAIDVDVLDVRVPHSARLDRRGPDVDAQRSHASRIRRREAKHGGAGGGLDVQLADGQPTEIEIGLDGAEPESDVQRHAARDGE